jgi:hypothetical protein
VAVTGSGGVADRFSRNAGAVEIDFAFFMICVVDIAITAAGALAARGTGGIAVAPVCIRASRRVAVFTGSVIDVTVTACRPMTAQ